MIPEKLEDSLNGGYRGLYGEVVAQDCYGLKDIDFVPAVIYDLGANVGVFTRFAKELFPSARIISVEPNADNIAVFKKFTDMTNVTLCHAAIGRGQVYHSTNAPNGAHEAYLSISDQISESDIKNSSVLELSHIPALQVYDLPWVTGKKVMKIDIEGNENIIWEDPEAVTYLSYMDYIVVEIHPHALHGEERVQAKENLLNAISFLELTHDVHYEHIYLTARKRNGD